MKTVLKIMTPLFISILSYGQNINFSADKLYPEGTAYSQKMDMFFVSSVHTGTVGKVDRKGNYTKFIDEKEFVSTIGLLVDDDRNLIYVNVSDPGASIKSTILTTGKLAKLAAYDLTTGKQKFIADLGSLNPTGGNFANDMTIDSKGNIYVTNSFSPIIFKVTQTGKASIFATSNLWKGEGFNLNGIVYHNNGYLLTTQMNTGMIYKVDVHSKKVSKVDIEPLIGSDGLILKSLNELILISNSAQTVYQISSTDNWKTAAIKNKVETVSTYPTTGVLAKGKIYVLNAKLNELFDPKAVKTSDFTLQQIGF
jgi:sugar lactone lactonase YvrE